MVSIAGGKISFEIAGIGSDVKDPEKPIFEEPLIPIDRAWLPGFPAADG